MYYVYGVSGSSLLIESTDSMISSTVNREYLVVKIFSDSLACAKIKRKKYIRNINDNAVQGSFIQK